MNPEFTKQLEDAGMRFVAIDGHRMKAFDLTGRDGHPYFVGVQFHPEYTTRPLRPSPPYMGLILAASGI